MALLLSAAGLFVLPGPERIFHAFDLTLLFLTKPDRHAFTALRKAETPF
jgi:hypothetical protein